ncbi:MAG: glycosyltransferase family 2 protein [Bacteroidota bacterium]|nr:glycosyltransferase family 2 protein [Bacteroidota bacterium]
MATYNGSNYIKKQVISILEQLSSIDELVISDDNSTDDTLAIIQSFNDARIKIFRNVSRIAGPVSNFENALNHANGEYIFLADQDDIWLSNKIETHIKAHEIHDLVISDCYVVKEDGQILYNSFFEERGSKAGFFKNLRKNSYIGCCMSFNRKILDIALPFPTYIHMHDWWIGLVAELKSSPFFCKDRLMYYVRHDSNASPTLEQSGYSVLKRIKNRTQLLFGLLIIFFKSNNK